MRLSQTVFAIIAFFTLFTISLAAQTGNAGRVSAGSVHRLATAANEVGRASPTLPMERMILLLRHRAGADEELERFLAEQLDPASPNYHHWLTPEEFGARFGISDEDLKTVTRWLADQGFSIDEVAKGRNWINFSGNASQVEAAFQTEIHDYLVNGKTYHANAIAPTDAGGLGQDGAWALSRCKIFRDAQQGLWRGLREH